MSEPKQHAMDERIREMTSGDVVISMCGRVDLQWMIDAEPPLTECEVTCLDCRHNLAKKALTALDKSIGG